ncbi:hypothetical protein C5Y96_24050 [Blastopirellula marina]|uniref:Uncharacterized protein n=1 Tax=Blastopirellula marina TaxID=124 RepID=A0A2S8EZW0_9BACT|nr:MULTISPECIES: hypothetical protein [Pirellulaceae]PQO25417.1 hypothetical protein C5Y96_24050 [Blastopirellula marina]RCS42381.1 hypothetical protein DTL36_24100 [Bremerella cremea]
MTSLLCVMAILTAPPSQKPVVSTELNPAQVEHQEPLEPHEIRKAIRTALRDEATSDSIHKRRKAIVRICALYAEMMLNEDFAEYEKEKLQAKLGSRLRSVRDDLKKLAEEQPAESLSEAKSANGGGAIDERGADELIELITTTIDPETWEVHGGKGSIFYFSNFRVLVVRQTQDVHAKLGGILGARP